MRVILPAPFDRFSGHYEELFKDPVLSFFSGNFFEYYLEAKTREILVHLERLGLKPESLKVLDVGCGTGLAAQRLEGKFREIHGVDASSGMIERAKALGLSQARFHVTQAGRLPFQENSFDLVYSMCLFHHVAPSDRLAALAEMERVLKPGGWMFHFEHNALNPIARLIVSRCAVDDGAVLMTASEMKFLYRAAGLLNDHARFILFIPKFLKPLQALEPALSWLPLGGQFYACGRKR